MTKPAHTDRPSSGDSPRLSIIVTIVSGGASLRRCLDALVSQIETPSTEVLVPYDRWVFGIEELAARFPQVRFHRIENEENDHPIRRSAGQHRLYDRRRAVGLSLARGELIAMTEDHAVPAADWCARILEVHEQSHAAIGGAIQNGVDRPFNWAVYYCDFGRYGLPFAAHEVAYASDVNISYKRSALEPIRHVWKDAYRETLVHDALRSRGETLFLDPRPVVHQERPPMNLPAALAERMHWGRVFAEVRLVDRGMWVRLLYAAGTSLLPALLLSRVWKFARRQNHSFMKTMTFLPIGTMLLIGWAIGECVGYVAGPAQTRTAGDDIGAGR